MSDNVWACRGANSYAFLSCSTVSRLRNQEDEEEEEEEEGEEKQK